MSIYLGVRKNVEENGGGNINTKDFLRKDGSIPLAGNLNLGNYAIDNLKTYPDGNKNATSRKYVDDETAKLLDLDGNRRMNGDLNMNDNAIIGIEDISADNSVPSKKFVKNENAKQNVKIQINESAIVLNTNRGTNLQNEINALKAAPLYSHYGLFLYQNPVANVYKAPYPIPAGFPDDFFWLTPDYNGDTKLTILALNTDNDTVLPTTNANFSIEGIFHSSSGGFNSTTILNGKNIHPYRIGTNNAYYFSHSSFTVRIRDLHNNWANWKKFQLKIAVPWGNNETRLIFYVTYF